jgi:hypothetical protein
MSDVCVHLLQYTTAAGISSARSWADPTRATSYGMEKAGGTVCPSRTKLHLPGHSSPASQAGRRVGPAQ